MKVTIELKYISYSEPLGTGHWDASYLFEEDVISTFLLSKFDTKLEAYKAVVSEIEKEITL